MQASDIPTGSEIRDNDKRRVRVGTVAEIVSPDQVAVDWPNGKRTTINTANISAESAKPKGKYTLVRKAAAA